MMRHENKFKIGDRVRFVEPYARLEAGAEGTVTGFWAAGVDVNVNGVDHGCFYSRVELIPAPTIETGKHYRTSSGKPTGRVTVGDNGFEAVVDGKVRIFDKVGGAVHGDDDIVEAWVPKVGERVRMTRKVDGHMSECAATIIHDDGSARRSLVIKFDREHSWAHSGERRAPDYHAYWVDASDLEPLPVARQPTTNVGAQVDTLAEEYGPAPASNDNAAKPKFKVGDRVRLVVDDGNSAKVGATGVVGPREEFGMFVDIIWDENELRNRQMNGGYFKSSFEHLTTPTVTTTAIVALIENGQPKPSAVPHVHAIQAPAEREANRLAGVHKGKQFGVFVLTTTAEEAAPTYRHEWQRLAEAGKKIDAIRELRGLTGMSLKPARDAVEHFIAYPYGQAA